MKHIKLLATSIVMAALAFAGCSNGNQQKEENNMKQQLVLTQEWDKVFPLSEKVNHRKVTFETQYGLTLAADLYTPKDAQGNLAAIAVSGPFGAVKEQSSGLYAMRMAEHGFVALAFDPSYTGESSGEPRRTASPDINTEDFMAAVDYLSKLENVDPERIGIIGICGWGGIALNAAAADTRIKATVASTMYDMTRVSGNGYFDSEDKEESRHAARETMGKQRLSDPMAMAGGVIDPLPEDAPQFVKDYHAYYKTPRGYHKRSLNSNKGWAASAGTSLMNTKLLAYADEIRNPVLIIHGEKAHSRYFGEGAFEKMTGKKANVPAKLDATKNWSKTVGNKELLVIPGASHVDLYDNLEKIPFEKLNEFFKTNLK